MFDFEWTGRREGDDSDHARGVKEAQDYCERMGIDPAAAYAAHVAAIEDDRDPPGDERSWYKVAWVAEEAYCEGWERIPENFALVWR